MSFPGAREEITQVVLSWKGVSAHPHRLGGTEYRFGRRELGHIHDDHLVDIPFPKKVRNQVVSAGLAEPHHILPESGWVSCYLNQKEDVSNALQLLQRLYELMRRQVARLELLRYSKQAQVFLQEWEIAQPNPGERRDLKNEEV